MYVSVYVCACLCVFQSTGLQQSESCSRRIFIWPRNTAALVSCNSPPFSVSTYLFVCLFVCLCLCWIQGQLLSCSSQRTSAVVVSLFYFVFLSVCLCVCVCGTSQIHTCVPGRFIVTSLAGDVVWVACGGVSVCLQVIEQQSHQCHWRWQLDRLYTSHLPVSVSVCLSVCLSGPPVHVSLTCKCVCLSVWTACTRLTYL